MANPGVTKIRVRLILRNSNTCVLTLFVKVLKLDTLVFPIWRIFRASYLFSGDLGLVGVATIVSGLSLIIMEVIYRDKGFIWDYLFLFSFFAWLITLARVHLSWEGQIELGSLLPMIALNLQLFIDLNPTHILRRGNLNIFLTDLQWFYPTVLWKLFIPWVFNLLHSRRSVGILVQTEVLFVVDKALRKAFDLILNHAITDTIIHCSLPSHVHTVVSITG